MTISPYDKYNQLNHRLEGFEQDLDVALKDELEERILAIIDSIEKFNSSSESHTISDEDKIRLFERAYSLQGKVFQDITSQEKEILKSIEPQPEGKKEVSKDVSNIESGEEIDSDDESDHDYDQDEFTPPPMPPDIR